MNAAAAGLFSLEGRVALITGASGGIGRALAEGYAHAGARVALSGRSAARLAAVQRRLAEQGAASDIFPADLSSNDAIRPLVDAVITRLGGIHVLVNCAGTNARMPIEQVTPDDYDRIMQTNLRSAYFLTQAVVPHMRAAGGGKIVNIGSLTSAIGLQDVSVYGMTKSALAQLTKTMAIEWAEDNIQVNCLCPGFIETELTQPLWQSPTRSQWMLSRLPLKRPGQPGDLQGMAIALASRASDYMTGQVVFVDGGFTAGSQW